MKTLKIPMSRLPDYAGRYIALADLRAMPSVSVTPSGNRWFWIAFQDLEEVITGNAAHGYADTKDEAILAGQVAIGFVEPAGPEPDFIMWPSGDFAMLHPIRKADLARFHGLGYSQWAKSYLSTLAAKKRAQRAPGRDDGASNLELAWIHGNGSGHWSKIRKKTAKRVFIEHDIYRPGWTYTDPVDAYQARTFTVDREKFERGEHIYCRRVYHCFVCSAEAKRLEDQKSQAEDARFQGEVASSFEVFKVDGKTEQEIKRSYRQQALLLHPDAGGDPDQFSKLHEEYQTALRTLCPQSP